MGDWKITKSSPRMNAAPKWELYNLADDLSETKNLAEDEPDQLAILVARFEVLNKEMIEPAWSPR